jgi:hypothetical protein
MTTLLAWIILGLADGPPPASDTVGDRVVAFARSKLGQTVGDGDCSTLASEALRAAGATRRERSWGEERASLADARPGDILVFEGTVFVRTRVREDGAIVTFTASSPHHVAVVSGVRKRGRRVVLTVLQQNVGFDGADEARKKVVREDVIDLAERKRGTLKAFRPVADPRGEPGR